MKPLPPARESELFTEEDIGLGRIEQHNFMCVSLKTDTEPNELCANAVQKVLKANRQGAKKPKEV